MTNRNYLEEALSYKGILDFDEEKARGMLENILSQPLLPMEYSKVMEKAQNYMKAWFLDKLSKKYPILSNEIFQLERHYDYGSQTVRGPSLFEASLESADSKGVAKIEVEGKDNYGNRTKYEIGAQIPPFIEEAREAYADSIKLGINLVKKAMNDGLMKRILLNDPGNLTIGRPYNSKYSIIWAPDQVEVKKISPPPQDPALIMKYAGVNLLIHQWDIPNEINLSTMLREFTESFPNASYREQEFGLDDEKS